MRSHKPSKNTGVAKAAQNERPEATPHRRRAHAKPRVRRATTTEADRETPLLSPPCPRTRTRRSRRRARRRFVTGVPMRCGRREWRRTKPSDTRARGIDRTATTRRSWISVRDESMRVDDDDDDAMVVMIQRDGCRLFVWFLITNATRATDSWERFVFR